ncbi:hypothetical protein FRC10_011963 [Ceratobasidium sp. 414]|nr:hypothetical protein FRC10_011963 [Ceratobasidium sp. 414]
MDALSDGVDIKRSLNNWRMYRAQLATTVQGFLTACTDLGSVCARASRQPYGRKDLNSALTDIDVELESLASEAESLRSARRSLATTRNLSTALTPIHTLPPEILTRIFMRVPTYEFTGISSYWRWIALTTPSLWTYLDITNQNNFDYGYLSLDRSDGLPLYFYISGYFDESDRQDRQLGFFLEAAPQISTLDIKSRSYNFPGAGMSMLRTWLGNSPVKGTKMLRILLVHDGSGPVPQWDQLLLFEYAEPVLSALTVLHLDNFHIPWPSAAYHDLVDLRLSIGSCHNAQATVSQLAHVFAASPGLSTLKLNGLKVVSSGDWDATKITTLIHLEVLCLLDMDDESLKLIMLLIPLSRSQDS